VGKLLSISLAVALQLGGLVGAHFYYGSNPRDVLIVVDSSYGLSGYQSQIEDWIDDYGSSARYSELHFATDKTYLGRGDANRDKLYRVSFGKMDVSLLNQNFTAREYDERVLLTFTGADANGWNVVSFQ
jgi:hypothetical protein